MVGVALRDERSEERPEVDAKRSIMDAFAVSQNKRHCKEIKQIIFARV